MADFLTRLVERTIGLVPVAQPIIPPMFAAGSEISCDNQPSSVWNDESHYSYEPQAPINNVHVTHPLETKPVLSSSDSMSSPQDDISSITPKQFLQKAPHQHTPPQHMKSNSLEQVEAVPSVMIKQNDQIISSEPVNQKDLADRKRSKVRLFISNESTSDKVVSEQSNESINTSLQHERSQRDVSEIGSDQLIPILSDTLESESHAMEIPPLKPYASGRIRSQNADAQKSFSSTQTVHVNIGRIEVRASISPQPQVQRSHPSGPSLTLDKYLRQRNEGRR